MNVVGITEEISMGMLKITYVKSRGIPKAVICKSSKTRYGQNY